MKNVERCGAYVEVVRGRKVPLGTKGVIVWIGYYERGYKGSGVDPYQCIQKIGIKDDFGNMWYTYTKNVELAEVDDLNDDLIGEIDYSDTYKVRVSSYVQYESFDGSYSELEEEIEETFTDVNDTKKFINNMLDSMVFGGCWIEVVINGKYYIDREF